MGISSPGIGSGLDINSIVSKLMTVESAPLATFDKKTAAFQSKVSALGSLSGAVSAFQGALSSLSTPASFQSVSANSGDTAVMVASATSKAAAGIYNVNVTQIAQAQTLVSRATASASGAIGLGATTTVSFQFGTVSGGRFGTAGSTLGAAVASAGIQNGALTLNGTAIATDSGTKSAKLLAEAINAKSATSGVSASAGAATTSATLFGAALATTFGDVDTSAGGTYRLSVGGVDIMTQGTGVAAGAGVSAGAIDLLLSPASPLRQALAAANITVSGTASDGSLRFASTDGANVAVTETVTGSVSGGIGLSSAAANSGSSVTATGAVTLISAAANPITVGGSDPTAAGLAAGQGGAYLDASFVQDANQPSGSVVIDSTNNSLQGIRDAINKAGLGVTASIVSDGSATPNHLVLTSTKTGVSSTMKITLAGSGGAGPAAELTDLLAYDPAGAQNLEQTSAAQSTALNVNGIAITSANNTVSGAIEGVTLTIGKVGSTNLNVAKDSSAVKSGVGNFIKAYNDLNKTIKDLSGYDAETKKGGPLLGDATVQAIQAQVRKQLSTAITGLDGNLTTLSQIGISFQKDGTLSLDGGKLQKAITDNFSDIGGLFAAVGKASNSQVSFTSSTAATKPGSYALKLTNLATQGTLTGSAALAGSTTIAADTSWAVTLNDTVPSTADKTATIKLTAGTYTPSELATLIQSSINGASKFSTAGASVIASIDAAGKLSVVSSRYGSVSNIAIGSITGTPVADLFGTGAPVAGLDVAGTLGGSAADGSGQFLTGAAGSPAEGLKIEVKVDDMDEPGTVDFSQGYAYQLNNLAASFLGAKGLITGRTTGLNASIKSVAKSHDDFADKLVNIEKRYRAQFTALDVAMSQMQTTSTYLTQQLAAITAQNN